MGIVKLSCMCVAVQEACSACSALLMCDSSCTESTVLRISAHSRATTRERQASKSSPLGGMKFEMMPLSSKLSQLTK